jgi:hypothetical protein
MPDIRRQWCNAIDAVADYTFDEYDAELPPNAPAHLVAMAKRVERMKSKLAETAEVMKTEAQALRGGPALLGFARHGRHGDQHRPIPSRSGAPGLLHRPQLGCCAGASLLEQSHMASQRANPSDQTHPGDCGIVQGL